MVVALPPVACAIAPEMRRVAISQTAKCAPRAIRLSRVVPRFCGVAALLMLIFGGWPVFGSTMWLRSASTAPYFAHIASLYANGVELWRRTMTTAASAFERPYPFWFAA